jgi:hypothetical protein
MFEMGVEVQVLKPRHDVREPRPEALRGLPTHDASRPSPRRAAAPREARSSRREPRRTVWASRRGSFWEGRDPEQNAKAAEPTPSTRWRSCSAGTWASRAAGRSDGEARALDYQIWCGPAMGAFNDWVAGSFLEPPRTAARCRSPQPPRRRGDASPAPQQLRTYGVPVPASAFRFVPPTPRVTGMTDPQDRTPDSDTAAPGRRRRGPRRRAHRRRRRQHPLSGERRRHGLLEGCPRGHGPDHGRPPEPLAHRGLLRPGSQGAGQDLREARRLRAGRRLRPDGLGRSADEHAGDGHLPAPRPHRGPAGPRRRGQGAVRLHRPRPA